MEEQLTVGELLEATEGLSNDAEVTFGSSRYSKRPLRFYRFKRRGEDLLQIELNEMDGDDWEDESELDSRITVGELREHLQAWKPSDRITFGSTASDAIPLYSTNPAAVFSLNLDQSA
ncbi:hypothetical protein MJO52_06465 [Microbulbifer variabilis]|uniref:Uncharacterized protein n=1 Tax=Microbulbifer variabilis TaxID=266805 RepID=A0ABY4VHB0_9GAMM|nr:hypothetical protein [Microbulbifer variabilis]USD22776.1 hypothetical protein MJO52_06465 [Microbulbifer variabilis]